MRKLTLTATQKKELNKSVSYLLHLIPNHTFGELAQILKAHNITKTSKTERSMDFNLSLFCFSIDETIKNDKPIVSLNPYVEVYDDNKGTYLGYTTIFG